jgi:hypothetical protein
MRRYPVACFDVKQVRLVFFGLTSKLQRHDEWCMLHHRGSCVKIEEKTIGLMMSGAA